MAKKETVIKTLKIDVKDDGVARLSQGLDKVKKKAKASEGEVDRVKKGVAEVANSTKNFSKQAQGLGGLVRAYATVAANVFALSAAYRVLKNSADLSDMVESSKALSATTGINYEGMARSLKEASAGALTFADSMRTANLAASVGVSGDNLERLTVLGTKAATALGMEVPSSINRLVKAVVKSQPDLLDQFGILVRLEDANNKYAESIGKAASELSQFEKTQATLNAILEAGENKFAGIETQAKPYQQLASSFLDIGQKLTEYLTGPITGLVTFIANNAALITIAMISLASKIVTLALPSITSFGQGLKENITDRIAESDKQVAKLDRRLRALKKVMNKTVSGEQNRLGGQLKKMIKSPEDLGFTKKAGFAKAIEQGASEVNFVKALNTSMKPYIKGLTERTKIAIETGADTVELRGQQIQTQLASKIVEAYKTSTATGQRFIENSARQGIARGVVGFQVFTARFKIAAVRMGQDLAMALEAGLSATSFRTFSANLRAAQSENQLMAVTQAGVAGVVFAGKTLLRTFSRVIPMVAGLTIAFEGFKFVATKIGILTENYALFNAAIKEGSKLLTEQETILKKVIAKREEGIESETFTTQLQYIDALVNSAGTLESAGSKILEAAEALASTTVFDRFLLFIMGRGSPEGKVTSELEKIKAQIEANTGKPASSEFQQQINDINSGKFSRKEDPSMGTPGRGAGYQAGKVSTRPLTEAEKLENAARLSAVLERGLKEANRPAREMQANFRAIEESATNINSNISASILSSENLSKASKPLRDIRIGLAGIREIAVDQTVPVLFGLDRAEAIKGFLDSLAPSALRYFQISKETLETEEGRAKALGVIIAEEARLEKRVISDISSQMRLKALEAELKSLKDVEGLFSGNLELVDQRRKIESDILSNKIAAERVDLNEQRRLINNLDLTSAERAGVQAKISAHKILISQLEDERSIVEGIAGEVEKRNLQLIRGKAIIDGFVEASKVELDIAEKRLKATERGKVDTAEALRASLALAKATQVLKRDELSQAKQAAAAAEDAVTLYKKENEQLFKKHGIISSTTDLINLEAAARKAELDVASLQLDTIEALYEAEQKVFENRKNNASFSIFGSKAQNAEAVTLFKEAMGKELDDFTRSMTNDVDRMVKAFTTTTDTFIDTLVDGFSGDSTIKDSIVDAFYAGAEALRTTLADFLKEDIKKGARDIFGELFGIDTKTVEEKQLSVQEQILDVLQTGAVAEDSVQDQLEVVKQSKTVFEGIQQKFGKGWEKVKDIFSSMFGIMKNLFTNLFTGIRAIFSSGGSSFGGVISEVVSGIGSFLSGSSSKAGVSEAVTAGSVQVFPLKEVGRAVELPFLARGGITNGPALAGEGSLREAVVPLPNGKSIPVDLKSSGAGNVTVYINVDVENNTTSSSATGGQSGRDYQELGKIISGAVKQEIMNQQRPGGLLA